jgi:hypothetical protein
VRVSIRIKILLIVVLSALSTYLFHRNALTEATPSNWFLAALSIVPQLMSYFSLTQEGSLRMALITLFLQFLAVFTLINWAGKLIVEAIRRRKNY